MSRLYWAVFRAAVVVGGFSGLVKLVAIFKESLVAFRVGTTSVLDAFLLAYAFPSFLLNVLTGSLATAFIPAYVRLRRTRGEAEAVSLAGGLSWFLLLALVVGTLLLAPACAGLIRLLARSFDAETLRLTITILYVLMPVMVLNGMTGFWSGFLNARERFATGAVVPIATPLAVIVGLAFFWESFGIYSLVIGTIVGGLCELIIVGTTVRRHGLRLWPLPAGWARDAGRILPEFAMAAGANVLIGATLLVDQAMAAMLGPGSVAVLGYGVRVPIVLVGVGTMALATALLPHLADLVVARRFSELRALIGRYALFTLGVSTLVTGALILFSRPIVVLLFERGSFVAEDSVLVASVQAAYALHIPFFACAMIAVRLISAMRANWLLALGSAISLLLDVLLNWYFSRFFGVVGIAMATAVVYSVACLYLWAVALSKLRRVERMETGGAT